MENETGSPLDRLSARIAARTTSADSKQSTDDSVFQQTFGKGNEGDPPPPEPGLLDRLAARMGQRDEDSPASSPDGYDIPVEGADPALTTFLQTAAHELKMTKRQTAMLAQKYDALVKNHNETQRKAAEENSKAITVELANLWGAEFEANSRAVNELTKGLSDSQFTALVHRLLFEHAKGQH